MKDLEKYIESLNNEFKKYSFEELKNYSEETILLYLYAYYHYLNADSSKIGELYDGNVIAWDSADHISGIYLDEDSDNNDLDVVHTEIVKDDAFDFARICKLLKDIEAYLFDTHSKELRKEIFDRLNDEDYKITNNKCVKIRIVTNFTPKTAPKRKAILNALNALKPSHSNVSFYITFGNEIEYEILEIESPKEYVDNAIVDIDSSENILRFGDENSLIVNLSAKSIKDIYEQYGYRGLFAQNLRYYVKNAKIDGNIIDTIENHPDNFWYYNNGIIIICDDYKLHNSKLSIVGFSVVNGGQTTKLIGESDIKNDFYVQCKIVKNKYSEDDERIEFIANVAEASNTQKPIRGKDLIANKPEQRRLKRQLAESGVYCQIKRGEKVNKKLYPNPWQNTTNEELGQFLLSFVYQKPGTARSNKASICSNEERYSLIFGKSYDSGFLTDLLRIKAYYKQWMTYNKKYDDGEDPYRLGLINNGMLYMTSIIGIICKYYYHSDYSKKVSGSIVSEQKIEVVSQHDIDHKIFLESLAKDDYYRLFEYCYCKFYRPGYEFLKSFKGRYNNYSNFTKVNSNYNTYVFKQIDYYFQQGIPEEDMMLMEQIFHCASHEELARDAEILKKYVNIVFADLDKESNIPDDVIANIKEALIEYRTKTYKKNRIKAYEVFKNVTADRIAKFAPTCIDDLIELRCLDEMQVELYGQDIVDIVSQYID